MKIPNQSNEEFYKLIAEKIREMIYVMDLKFKITYISDAVQDLLGFSPDEFLSMRLDELLTPDSYNHIMKIFLETIANEASGKLNEELDIEIEMIRKNGTKVWVELSRAFQRDVDGNAIAIVGAARDISRRKATEEKLQKSEANLAEAQRIAKLGIWDWNMETDEDVWSEECYKIFGLACETFTPKLLTFLDYVHPLDRDRVMSAVEESRLSGKRYNIEHRIIRADGDIRYVKEEAEVLLNSEGEPYRMIGTMLDITSQKRVEMEMIDARARAEFFNDLLAHDISNIHQGLMASLELILIDEQIPERTKVFAENALSQVERSIELIRRVRKFASVGSEDQSIESIDFYTSFYTARDAIRHSFPQKIIRINTNIFEGKFKVIGNDLLFDVWFNLLHNATKFDKSNNVIIDIFVKDADDSSFYKVQIDDRGSGISEERKTIILKRLEYSAASTSGIGLTLVKQIIHTYGGRIWIEDRVDDDYSQGASIVFEIPKG